MKIILKYKPLCRNATQILLILNIEKLVNEV